MPSVPVLSWQQLFDRQHDAQVLCDSSQGSDWNVALYGTGPNNTPIKARTVIVDNMGNDAIVFYTFGLSSYQIPAFTRRTVYIQTNQTYLMFKVTKGVLTLTFCDFDPDLPDEQNEVATNTSANQASNQPGSETATAGTFVTLNASDRNSQVQLSGGNLIYTLGQAGTWGMVRCGKGKTAGKWYWEYLHQSNVHMSIGVAMGNASLANNMYLGADNKGLGWNGGNSYYYNGSASANQGYETIQRPGTWTAFALDVTAKRLWFGRIGSTAQPWLAGGALVNPTNPATGLDISAVMAQNPGQPIFAAFSAYQGGGLANFGASPFQGLIPSGYKGWDTT